jgi:hypothetical protein
MNFNTPWSKSFVCPLLLTSGKILTEAAEYGGRAGKFK